MSNGTIENVEDAKPAGRHRQWGLKKLTRRFVDWFCSPGVGRVQPSDELVLERELRRGMRGDGG